MFYAFTSWNWFSGYEFRMNSSFKTFIFSTEGCFMLCFIEIGFQEQKSFKMLTIILTVSKCWQSFLPFRFYPSLWITVWSLICTNWNLLIPMMRSAKFGWNWVNVAVKEVKKGERLQVNGRTDRRTTSDHL